MNKHTTTLLSSDKKLNLSLYIQTCDKPKGIVVITHGMCEHKERYFSFIKYLCTHQFNCVIYDHRGHGESILDTNDLGYFYDDSAKCIVEDLNLVIEYAKSLFPALPCYLFAHSMGTLVSQNYLQKYNHKINGFISCGQPSKNPLSAIGIKVAKIIAKIKGERHRSNLLQSMSLGAYNKGIEGTLESRWICTDQEVVKAYMANPKCHYVFTANGFINLLTLLNNCYKIPYIPSNKSLPIMFIAGANDPVIENKDKHLEAQNYMKQLGYNNVCSHLYEGLRHEILNEPNKDIVLNDILEFLINMN